jgi:hypothetical protein
MRIRLDQIDASHKQGALHRPGVKMYREMVRARKKLPPLRLECGRRGQYELLDGFHRFAALRAEGRKYADVQVTAN